MFRFCARLDEKYAGKLVPWGLKTPSGLPSKPSKHRQTYPQNPEKGWSDRRKYRKGGRTEGEFFVESLLLRLKYVMIEKREGYAYPLLPIMNRFFDLP